MICPLSEFSCFHGVYTIVNRDNCIQIVRLGVIFFPSAAVCAKIAHTEFFTNSPYEKIYDGILMFC